MSQTFDRIDASLVKWIDGQHVFFVATAPLDGNGLVNCSPKGLDSLRVTGERELVYVDFTGSGVETIAHLKENGRIVIMMCAFEGPPRIVRLQGRGDALAPGSAEFAALIGRFPAHLGVRALIRVRVERISDSCGYAVPLMRFERERDALPKWAEKRGEEGVREYQREKNATSLDGLVGVDWL
jgi:Pyridoxamine 5'-phosphate oxidase